MALKTYCAAAAAAKPLQSCPTLCDPLDGSPPGSAVPGILQARTLEWVAISFSNARKWKVKVKLLSHVRLLATPWTAAYQAPLSMGFSRQECWSGVPLPSPDSALHYVNSNVILGLENCKAFVIFGSLGYSSICCSFFGTHINLTYMIKNATLQMTKISLFLCFMVWALMIFTF